MNSVQFVVMCLIAIAVPVSVIGLLFSGLFLAIRAALRGSKPAAIQQLDEEDAERKAQQIMMMFLVAAAAASAAIAALGVATGNYSLLF